MDTAASPTKKNGRTEEDEDRWPFLFYVCGQDTAKFLDLAPPTTEKRPQRKQSTLSRTGGRVVRILVVGRSSHKDQIVHNLKHRGGQRQRRHAENTIETEVSVSLHRPIIFNTVPAHDLDGPNTSADFEAYVTACTACLIVADAQHINWVQEAIRWSDRVRDTKRIPSSLMLHCDTKEETQHPDLTHKFSAFVDQTSSTSCGCFIHSHDFELDESDKCLQQLINSADANRLPPGTPRCGGLVNFSSPFENDDPS